jgi:hypothetical protein
MVEPAGIWPGGGSGSVGRKLAVASQAGAGAALVVVAGPASTLASTGCGAAKVAGGSSGGTGTVVHPAISTAIDAANAASADFLRARITGTP